MLQPDELARSTPRSTGSSIPRLRSVGATRSKVRRSSSPSKRMRRSRTQPALGLANARRLPRWRACATRKPMSMRVDVLWMSFRNAIVSWSSCSNSLSRSSSAIKDKRGDSIRLEGNWDHVADVLNAFREYPKAIEFRHESWDDPWVLNALREHEPRGSTSTSRD
jgi:hypothetical protein